MEDFKNKIKTARRLMQLSQLKASQKLNIPKATLQSWEQGKRTPNFVTRAWALKEIVK